MTTIVMYHFVRPIAGSPWPRIRGLERELFSEQVAYLCRHHQVVRLADLVEAARGGAPLPECAAVLTFDDGYADHYRHAFPVLRKAGITGAFFPPSGAILDRRVLDVNKVHFVLAAVENAEILVEAIERAIEAARGDAPLESLQTYRERYWAANRFDPAEVIYVKRMLQVGLPATLRARIADALFRKHVTEDEHSFADDLYVSTDELAEMVGAGMEVGTHGHAHSWLDSLDRDAQASDVDRSLALLDAVGLPRTDFLFCYPFGAYNADTLSVLRERGCAAAVTTRVALASAQDDRLELPRLDTNDLPKDKTASASTWTRRAMGLEATT